MTYTVIVSVGKKDIVFRHVYEFWIDTKDLILNMGDHHVHFKDYDGLIIKGDGDEREEVV